MQPGSRDAGRIRPFRWRSRGLPNPVTGSAMWPCCRSRSGPWTKSRSASDPQLRAGGFRCRISPACANLRALPGTCAPGKMTSRRDLFVVATFAALLGGCGEDPAPAAQGAPAATSAAAPAATGAEAEQATRGMVSGVAPGRAADAVVDLKFELKSRPEVGKPLTIDIALLPNVASEVMNVTYLA